MIRRMSASNLAMKKSIDKAARKPRRPVDRNRVLGKLPANRKTSWLRWGGVLAVLAVLGYLAITGKIFSAGEWQMATANFRNWFRSAPVPEDDPEEAAVPEINPRQPPGPAPARCVYIPGGWYWRGYEGEDFPDAQPLRKIYVDGFWMGQTEVTNEEWAEFVNATGYLTVAERQPTLKEIPGLRPEAKGFQASYVAVFATAPCASFPNAVPWWAVFASWPAFRPFSLVFAAPAFPVKDPREVQQLHLWWKDVPGADWRHPQGPQTSIKGLEKHPVVHVCWHDAVAFCEWKSKKLGKTVRLPTEAEWEFAARGGLDRKPFCWGDELTPGGKWQCNVWQGKFPNHNEKLDGFEGTAPVASFSANGYGLHDMAGNVWEWCSDWYQADYYTKSPKINPKGPASSFDPLEPTMAKRVQRGGSFLCCDNYCKRYLPGARGKGEPSSAANHIGFRYVIDVK
jgi:formylglycine-generating enzyme required for sulfatase activity